MTGGEHGPPAGLPEGQSHSESQSNAGTRFAEAQQAGGQPRLWWESSAASGSQRGHGGRGGQRASCLGLRVLEACGDSPGQQAGGGKTLLCKASALSVSPSLPFCLRAVSRACCVATVPAPGSLPSGVLSSDGPGTSCRGTCSDVGLRATQASCSEECWWDFVMLKSCRCGP